MHNTAQGAHAQSTKKRPSHTCCEACGGGCEADLCWLGSDEGPDCGKELPGLPPAAAAAADPAASAVGVADVVGRRSVGGGWKTE